MPEFGGFWSDSLGRFGGHLDEFWRNIVRNLREIKRRVEVTNLVFKKSDFLISLFFQNPCRGLEVLDGSDSSERSEGFMLIIPGTKKSSRCQFRVTSRCKVERAAPRCT